MRLYFLALVVLVLVSPACDGRSTASTPTSPSSGASSPTPPAGPSAAASLDVTGTWVFALNNLKVTWALTQTGDVVTGTALVVDTNNPYYGAGVIGTITGTVANGGFVYTQTHATLLVAGCTETDTGQMTLSGGNSLTGTNTEVNSCKRAPAVNVVTFVKQ
ncbi:MAG: hypothetical protein ABI634_18220 [Acidobacteriota bacterium]